jgi:2-polyprenyl-3-methyl-5-hydroxy-6-metoxy-1,4-benzoquinol methylase
MSTIDSQHCPACLSIGTLKYAEKIENALFNELTFASRKRPELMHYDLFECEKCKTLFTNRNVNLKELLNNYENAEYDSNIEAKFAAKTYVKYLTKALPSFKGSVLDIGAGDGAFLSEARKVFATSNLGIEPSIKAIEKKDDSQVKIANLAIEDFKPNEKYDMVTCFQTIEHLNDPRQFISNMKNFLKPGGFMVISCHNRLSLVNRLLGEKSPIFDVEHLQVFTSQGIELLFQSLNLEIVYSKKYRNEYPLSYWLKIAPIGEKIKNFVESRKKLFKKHISINVGNHLIVGKVK